MTQKELARLVMAAKKALDDAVLAASGAQPGDPHVNHHIKSASVIVDAMMRKASIDGGSK